MKVHKENNFYLFTSLLKGFLKNWSLGIKLIGVGYRFVKVKKRSFSIKIGLSHLLKYYVNYEIRLLRTTKRNSKIIFFSTNKEALCSLISTLRLIRVPDNYKGKGFQLLNEIVYIKKREKFGVF